MIIRKSRYAVKQFCVAVTFEIGFLSKYRSSMRRRIEPPLMKKYFTRIARRWANTLCELLSNPAFALPLLPIS